MFIKINNNTYNYDKFNTCIEQGFLKWYNLLVVSLKHDVNDKYNRKKTLCFLSFTVFFYNRLKSYF